MERLAQPLVLAAALCLAPPVGAQAPPTGGPAQGGVGPTAPTGLEIVRIERALQNRFACLGCHRVQGEGGLVGPELDGIATRVDAAYLRTVIADPVGSLPGTRMPRQPMPDREVERLAAYLLSLPGPAATAPGTAGSPVAPPEVAPRDSLDGAALYARHCAACHGGSGAGDGWNAVHLPVPPTVHADSVAMSRRPDDTLYDAIAVGGWVLDRGNRMPGFDGLLSPSQIRALVAHIRTLCGCSQPAWAGDGG